MHVKGPVHSYCIIQTDYRINHCKNDTFFLILFLYAYNTYLFIVFFQHWFSDWAELHKHLHPGPPPPAAAAAPQSNTESLLHHHHQQHQRQQQQEKVKWWWWLARCPSFGGWHQNHSELQQPRQSSSTALLQFTRVLFFHLLLFCSPFLVCNLPVCLFTTTSSKFLFSIFTLPCFSFSNFPDPPPPPPPPANSCFPFSLFPVSHFPIFLTHHHHQQQQQIPVFHFESSLFLIFPVS